MAWAATAISSASMWTSPTNLARRLGKRAEFVSAGYDSLYDVLRVGQADATISALPIDPGKFGLWAYSEPYFEAGQVLVTKPCESLPKLSQGSIAVEYGSDADAAARHLARRRAGVAIKYTQSAADALKAVDNGWVDAAIVDGVSAKQLLPKYPALQIVEQVTSDPYAIAVWGESTQLARSDQCEVGRDETRRDTAKDCGGVDEEVDPHPDPPPQSNCAFDRGGSAFALPCHARYANGGGLEVGSSLRQQIPHPIAQHFPPPDVPPLVVFHQHDAACRVGHVDAPQIAAVPPRFDLLR